jgi:hypothetical protein
MYEFVAEIKLPVDVGELLAIHWERVVPATLAPKPGNLLAATFPLRRAQSIPS